MKRPFFTKDQELWICDVIGAWYFQWKYKICGRNGMNNLGFAKEQLKALLCDDKDFIDKTHTDDEE